MRNSSPVTKLLSDKRHSPVTVEVVTELLCMQKQLQV